MVSVIKEKSDVIYRTEAPPYLCRLLFPGSHTMHKLLIDLFQRYVDQGLIVIGSLAGWEPRGKATRKNFFGEMERWSTAPTGAPANRTIIVGQKIMVLWQSPRLIGLEWIPPRISHASTTLMVHSDMCIVCVKHSNTDIYRITWSLFV